ncbi:MAG: response regulator transcription factor [Chloroflexi bacterium]|nr:response regulator transcription factor [Chloroflexota bacterium]
MSVASDDLRVLVVADDALARAGLATVLSSQPGLAVVGQVASDTDLPAQLEVYRPDVLVWDAGWNPAPSLDRMSDMRDTVPPILALLPGEAYAGEALIAGAHGLFSRDTGAPTLAAAAAAVARGALVIDPTLAGALLAPRERPSTSPAVSLTPRELEVLGLLVEGAPNKTIAQKLGISENTVKFHVNAILGKLGAQSRTEAVIRATRLGLIHI